MDLVAVEVFYDEYGNICYDTKLSMEIPEGYVGLIFPRSSISKYMTFLTNATGVIDSGYRGSILFKFKPTEAYHSRSTNHDVVYKVGDKIGQIIILPFPKIEFEESQVLSETERNDSGFGSTGN